jgi:hypothetical protein
MTNNGIDLMAAEKKIKRCAIFKIDLKGRFVYVDTMTEQFLQYPMERLFGRNIKTVLAEESYATILAIFRGERHYETSFQAVNLDFIDADNNKHSFGAIITLNFIAGNPANYQVVLIPNYGFAELLQNCFEHDDVTELLLSFIADIDSSILWGKLTDIFLNWPEIWQTGLYVYNQKTLGLLASSTRIPNSAEGAIDLTATDHNHLMVVLEHRRHISSLNSRSTNLALPVSIGLFDAVYPLTYRDKCWGILRFICNSDPLTNNDTKLGRIARFLGNALFSFINSQEDL